MSSHTMCYIIYNKLNKKINDQELIEAYASNPHGIGISYCKCGVLQKPLKYFNGENGDIDWFINDVLPKIIELNCDSNVTNLAIHFRYCSAGNISKDNVHPFEVNDNIHFMMNGTSSNEKMITNDGKSDTHNIALWLAKANPKSLFAIKKNDELYYQLCCYLGKSNGLLLSNDKCLIIHNKPENEVWNENKTIYRSSSNTDLASKWAKLDK